MRKIIPTWFAIMATVSAAVVCCGTYKSLTAETASTTENVEQVCINEEQTLDTQVTLKDYFWLDSIPRNAYTPFKAYLFKDGMGTNNQFASAFKIMTELFEHRESKDKIDFTFPHDNRCVSCTYSITSYSNPKYPFLTAALTLNADPQNGGKSTTYYSGPELKMGAQCTVKELQPALNTAYASIKAMER